MMDMHRIDLALTIIGTIAMMALFIGAAAGVA